MSDAVAMAVDSQPAQLDEALYSRQLYVLGHDAMQKMSQSSVLIVGGSGLAVEIAKNLVLAGVKLVTLNDQAVVSHHDLSSNFFLQESDIGKHRIDVLIPKLSELNEYVHVMGNKAPLTPELIAAHQVVVACDTALTDQIRLNEVCRANSAYFVSANSYGVFASVFCDFGQSFVVTDINGEQPMAGLITSVTQDEIGVVTVLEDHRHGLQDGEFVKFSDIRGMIELNDAPPQPVKVTGPHTFTIGDTRQFSAYVGGGRYQQVKQPITLSFATLSEALKSPELMIFDFAKLDSPPLIHLCVQALDLFVTEFGQRPAPGNRQHGDRFVQLVTELASASEGVKVDEKIVRSFAHCATGSINPVAAFVGGVAAQETLKAITNKFTPIKQFLYFDAIESLPDNLLEMDAKEFEPTLGQERYRGQISVFGQTLQNALLNSRMFLVGAGAIGCELLKNFALMGVGCGADGMVTVTDMDKIEKSNLNRQFLFRPWHIDRPKSVTACEAAVGINPALHVTPHQHRVGPDTEKIYNDDFFDHLHFVCNALDNVEARLYVDSRCVLYQKPLLESGTLGTKGNVQVIVPHLTESYGSSVDPPEQGIPICTLKHFPHKIEHTIQWARDEFHGVFTNQMEDVNRYLSAPNFVQSLKEQRNTRQVVLESIHANLVSDRPQTFDQCIVWGRLRFESLFNHSIRQLLHNFPPDMKDSTGNDFWSGAKRAPIPLQFDITSPLHLDFVIAAANLRAFNYGLKGHTDTNAFVKVLKDVNPPEFKPVQGLHIPTNDREAEGNAAMLGHQSNDMLFEELLKSIPPPSELAGYRLSPVEFEKDDDTNFHIQFITATSNLRASNYGIPLVDTHETKRIAGKIIPAIATTTALVTGLVALELIKIIQSKPLVAYKNAFVNLALPFLAFSEPIAPPKIKSTDREWTLWDNIRVDIGDVTLREFLEYFKKTHQLDISMISYGRSMLFSVFVPQKKLEERYKLSMSELTRTISKSELPPGSRYLTLEVCCASSNGDDVEVPTVRFKYR